MRIELKVYSYFEPMLDENIKDTVNMIFYRIDSIAYYEGLNGELVTEINSGGAMYYSPVSLHEIDMELMRNRQEI